MRANNLNEIKPYLDHDPDIEVSLTGDEEKVYSMRLKIENYSFLLHVRSAIDLSQKLQKAIATWIGESTLLILSAEEYLSRDQLDRVRALKQNIESLKKLEYKRDDNIDRTEERKNS